MSASAKVETPNEIVMSRERLIEILTPKNINISLQKRIPKNIYITRKELLSKKLTTILDILHTNYWQRLSEFTSKLSIKTSPIAILTKIKTDSFNGSNARQYELIYLYLIDVYIVVYYLQILELSVEDGIEYNEIDYDGY